MSKRKYLDETIEPEYVANNPNDIYGAQYGMLPEIIVTPKGQPNITQVRTTEKAWQKYWGDKGAASVSRAMGKAAPYVLDGMSLLMGNPVTGALGTIGGYAGGYYGSKLGESIDSNYGGAVGGFIGGLLGGATGGIFEGNLASPKSMTSAERYERALNAANKAAKEAADRARSTERAMAIRRLNNGESLDAVAASYPDNTSVQNIVNRRRLNEQRYNSAVEEAQIRDYFDGYDEFMNEYAAKRADLEHGYRMSRETNNPHLESYFEDQLSNLDAGLPIEEYSNSNLTNYFIGRDYNNAGGSLSEAETLGVVLEGLRDNGLYSGPVTREGIRRNYLAQQDLARIRNAFDARSNIAEQSAVQSTVQSTKQSAANIIHPNIVSGEADRIIQKYIDSKRTLDVEDAIKDFSDYEKERVRSVRREINRQARRTKNHNAPVSIDENTARTYISDNDDNSLTIYKKSDGTQDISSASFFNPNGNPKGILHKAASLLNTGDRISIANRDAALSRNSYPLYLLYLAHEISKPNSKGFKIEPTKDIKFNTFGQTHYKGFMYDRVDRKIDSQEKIVQKSLDILKKAYKDKYGEELKLNFNSHTGTYPGFIAEKLKYGGIIGKYKL